MRRAVQYHARASRAESPDYDCRLTLTDVRRLAPTYSFNAYRAASMANGAAPADDTLFFQNLARAMGTSPAVLVSRYIISGTALAPGLVLGATALGNAAAEGTSSLSK